jgi:hypothetical protein
MAIPNGFKKLKRLEDMPPIKNRAKCKKSYKEVAWTPNSWAVPVYTFQSLVDELMRNIKGDKDLHDKFIESYIATFKPEIKKQFFNSLV